MKKISSDDVNGTEDSDSRMDTTPAETTPYQACSPETSNNTRTVNDTMEFSAVNAVANSGDTLPSRRYGRKRFLNCCVHGCPVTSRNARHLKFFRFPSNPLRSQLWAKFTRRKSIRTAVESAELNGNQSFRICSAHFKIVDFTDPCDRSKLNSGAVPSVFDVSSCPWYLIKDYKLPVPSDQPLYPENSSARDVPLIGNNMLVSERKALMVGSQESPTLASSSSHPPVSPATSSSSGATTLVLNSGVDYSDLCAYHRLFVRSVTFVGTELEELKFCAKCGASTTDPVNIAPNVFQIKCHRGHSLLVTNELNQRCHEWLSACHARHRLLGKSDPPFHSPCHLCDDHFVPPHRRPPPLFEQTVPTAAITGDSNTHGCNGTAKTPTPAPHRRKFRHVKENGLPPTFPTLVRHAFRFSVVPTKNASVNCCVSTKDAYVDCVVKTKDVSISCHSLVPTKDASVGGAVTMRDVSAGCRISMRDVSVGCHVSTWDASTIYDRLFTSDASVGCEVETKDASVGCEVETNDVAVACDSLPELPSANSQLIRQNADKVEEQEQLNGDVNFTSPLTVAKQRQLISLLRTRLNELNKTADNLRQQVTDLRDMNINEDIVIDKVLPNYLKGVSLKLVETQVRLTKRKRLARWPPFILALGKVIDNESHVAYNIVRQLWNFPARQTLRKLPDLPNEMLTLKRFIAEYFHGVALMQERPMAVVKKRNKERSSSTLQTAVRVEKVPVVEAAMGRMLASDSDDDDELDDDEQEEEEEEEEDEDDVDKEEDRYLVLPEKRSRPHNARALSTAVDEAAIAAEYLLHSEVPFANEEVTATTSSLMDEMPIFMDTEPYNELEVQTSLAPASAEDSVELTTSVLPPQITLENGTMVYQEIAEDGSTIYHHCQILGQFDTSESVNSLTFHAGLLENDVDDDTAKGNV